MDRNPTDECARQEALAQWFISQGLSTDDAYLLMLELLGGIIATKAESEAYLDHCIQHSHHVLKCASKRSFKKKMDLER
jgi:hypothetical protein